MSLQNLNIVLGKTEDFTSCPFTQVTTARFAVGRSHLLQRKEEVTTSILIKKLNENESRGQGSVMNVLNSIR